MRNLEEITNMMEIVQANIDAEDSFFSVSIEEAKIQIDTLTHEAFKYIKAFKCVHGSTEYLETIHDIHHDITRKYWLWRQEIKKVS